MAGKIVDQYGRPMSYGTGGTPIHQAANWSYKRQNIWDQSTDNSASVSGYSRDKLSQIGRWLYANDTAIRGAVNEIATFSALNTTRIFTGENKTFGGLASEYLAEQDKSADIRGFPFTMEALARSYVIATIIDGDMYPVMVRDEAGMPRLQSFRAHRVGGFDAKINLCDGVQVNKFGRPISYRVKTTFDKYEDIPASAFIPLLLPDHCDQFRGASILATPANDAQDLKEAKAWELIAQKVAAGIALVEESETSDPLESTKNLMDGGMGVGGNKIIYEESEGGMIRHIRAGSGAGLKPFLSDRPTANQAEFVKRVLRSVFCSMMWPYEFCHDPTLAGGAAMRVIMEKVNATIDYVRESIVTPLYYKFDNFRIACAIEDGILPQEKEWWKWNHFGPPRLTADKRYDAQVDAMEFEKGFITLQEICARNARDYRDVIKQRVSEEKLLQDECKAAGVDPSRISMMAQTELNPGNASSQEDQPNSNQSK